MDTIKTNWQTVAPIYQNYRCLLEDIDTPIFFSQNGNISLSMRELPQWVKQQAEIDKNFLSCLSLSLRDHLKGAKYAFVVEYMADAMGAPDPDRKDPSPRTIQEAMIDKIQDAQFVLWLANPSVLNFFMILHGHESSDGKWRWRGLGEWSAPWLLLPEHSRKLDEKDFEKAVSLYKHLESEDANWLRTAKRAVMKGLAERDWISRYLMLWLAVESLFGPENPGETTFRLSQRVALFLDGRSEEAKNLFKDIKTGYNWRSKIVHGLRLKKIKQEEAVKLISKLEDVIRRAFTKILSDVSLLNSFGGSSREKYLEELIFQTEEG